MANLRWIFAVMMALPLAGLAGNPKGINISGRLVDTSTNLTLSSSGVDFTLKILSPDNCLLYEERHLNKDLSASGGTFSLILGEGSSPFNVYSSVSGEEQSRENLLKVFSNSSPVIAGLQSEAQGSESVSCSGSYAPAAGDVRKVKIVFDPGTGGPRAILPYHKIGTVPYAMVAEESAKSADSDRLGGQPAASFAKLTDLATAVTANETDPSVRAFAKAALPSCGAGEVLKSNGTAFSCVTDTTGGSPAVATTTSTGIVQVGTGLAVDGAGILSVASLPISQITGLQTALNDRLNMAALPECLADQTMTWVSITDAMSCVNITISASDVSDFATAVDARITAGNTASPKLPLAGGTMTGDLNMGGRDVLSSGHITMNPGKTLLMSNLSQAQEDALVLTAAHKGLSWYNTDLKALRVYDGATKQTVIGSTAGCSDGQVLKWNNGTQVWACSNDAGAGGADASTIRSVNVDVTGMTQGNFLQYNGTSFVDMTMPVCTADQTLSFTALGAASCVSISGLTDSAIAAGAAIARTKIAANAGAANHVLINDAAGALSSEAQLATSRGGTGHSTYLAGQLLIGKADGTLAKATLTAGTNISVTNGDGAITINSTVDGATLANLNASNLSSGTVSSTLLPVVPIAKGGTGGATAADARTNLGLGTAAQATLGNASGNVPQLGLGGLVANKLCVADGGGNSIQCSSDMPVSSQWLTSTSDIYYSAGKVGIGPNAPSFNLDIQSADSFQQRLFHSSDSDYDGAAMMLTRTRGTLAANSAVLSGNTIGGFYFRAHDGAGTGTTSSAIEVSAGENHSATNRGTIMTFETTANGSAARAERMRIHSNGNVGIGTATPGARLDVNGEAKINGLNLGRGGGGASDSSVAFGLNALPKNLATGYQNTAIGSEAMSENTNGNQNTAVGSYSLRFNVSGYNNTAIGAYALEEAVGNLNTAVGVFAMQNTSSGVENVAMGENAMNANTTGSYNTVLGQGASVFNQTGGENTIVGEAAGRGVSGNSYSRNTIIGSMAGYVLSTGSNNVLLGHKVADNMTTGAKNIVIGYDIDAPAATSTNTLNIGNLIYGTGLDGAGTTLSTGNIGIGTNAPGARLDVKGAIRMSGSTSGYTGFQPAAAAGSTVWTLPATDGTVGQVLKTDGAGNLGWVSAGTGSVTGVSSANAYLTVANGSTTPSLTLNVGTAANTVAAGDDARITGALQSSAYVIDVTDAVSCAANNKPYWNTVSDKWMCATIGSLDASAITAGIIDGARLPASATYWGAALGGINFAGGSVGIGVVTPTAKLDVNGEAKINGLVIGRGGNATNPLNSAVGFEALQANNGNGSANTAVGYQSLKVNVEGANNTAVGTSVLTYGSVGDDNTGIGAYALADNTANQNTAVGARAMLSNDTGSQNVAVGDGALEHSMIGNYNTIMGSSAAYFNEEGGENVIIGRQAGYGSAGNSNSANTMVGTRAGYVLSTGSNNLLLGYKAADNLTTGSNNIIIGYDIDAPNATGSGQLSIGNLIFGTGLDATGTAVATGNVGIGVTTPGAKLDVKGAIRMSGATSGYVGFQPAAAAGSTVWTLPTADGSSGYVLKTNGAGILSWGPDAGGSIDGLSDASTSGTGNIFLGEFAGALVTTGNANTAVGYNSMKSVTTGGNNVAIGEQALYSLTNNYSNVAIGDGAAYSNNGTRNVIIGSWAFDGNTIGSRNTALGEGALGDSTTGDDNVAVGQGSGQAVQAGARNVFLGTYAGSDSAKRPLDNNILIGYDAQVPTNNKSNFLNIGNTIYADLSTDAVGIGTASPGYKLDVQGGDINASGSVRAAGVALTSDIRYKRDIASIESPLEKILNLRGVTYDWRREEFPGKHFSERRQLGVIAQEVEVQFPEAVDTDKSGYKSVNYPALVAPLIEAVRELYLSIVGTQSEVAALKADNAQIKAENVAMKAWICKQDPSAPFCQ